MSNLERYGITPEQAQSLGLPADEALTVLASEPTPTPSVGHGLSKGDESVEVLVERFRANPARREISREVQSFLPPGVEVLPWQP